MKTPYYAGSFTLYSFFKSKIYSNDIDGVTNIVKMKNRPCANRNGLS
nr:MAG TPA: hypothetical protein [Caudoviricetes sp.]